MNIEGIDKNLANLMAYVVQVDGTVSNEEISVFNEFLKGRFPEEESNAIFDGFVSALKERPLLESVLDEVRSSYDEDELARLRFVVSLYELISADGITDRELGTFKTVCSFLSIKDENTDLISSLLIPSYQYEFIENVGRKLSAGEDPERFDLVYSVWTWSGSNWQEGILSSISDQSSLSLSGTSLFIKTGSLN